MQEVKEGIAKSELDLAKVSKDLEDCEEEILRLIGATKEDLEAFRQKLGVIEGKVRQMESLSNDVLADRRAEVVALENELNELRKDKLSVIPEFYDKILSLAKRIKGLYREKKIDGYVVGTWAQDRDCLWNIAGKSEIYGDPFMWPKIWQANTDIIRNPDIIHPGQVLKILPAGPKTDEESKAERRYWRNKRAAENE
jgi:nucleoid-associated protein YgaU